MLHGSLGEEDRKKNDELTLTHSERFSLFENSSKKDEHKDVVLAIELVIEHRKLDVH